MYLSGRVIDSTASCAQRPPTPHSTGVQSQPRPSKSRMGGRGRDLMSHNSDRVQDLH
ncbi:hypothetical protein POX_e06386 [Penicillium oxalicum]|uniref:hypothetical protein n=1 Tax=Penicillium oxalicum TaxID=69781 RepID=UPI0020B68C4D|nr:hypothetical protein POX_e06386 [Penicillium oxalicum]KAI2788371.1 hypothetical protein POX_e06386 [Penicillium oxalicum]